MKNIKWEIDKTDRSMKATLVKMDDFNILAEVFPCKDRVDPSEVITKADYWMYIIFSDFEDILQGTKKTSREAAKEVEKWKESFKEKVLQM